MQQQKWIPIGIKMNNTKNDVLYNPFQGSQGAVDYFCIPFDHISDLNTTCGNGKTRNKRRINFTWNARLDTYKKIEQYRCSSFEEMCAKK